MTAPSHGYAPNALAILDDRAATAAASLRRITSTDPEATEAIAAVRRLQSLLELGWVPAIRTILRSGALSGSVPVFGFHDVGGGGGGDSWTKSEDGPEPGTLTFQPLNALSSLFPGDDDITGEEIAELIGEILEADPSVQQLLDLGVLTNALEEIAMNTALPVEVVEALGPAGLTALYARLHDLGYPYPVLETPDPPRLEPDLPGVIEAFGLVVAQAIKRPGPSAVIEEVIADAGEWPILRYVAPLAGLARVDNLPDHLADQLLAALRDLEDRDLHRDTMRPTNVAYPGLPSKTESLIAVLFGGNPRLNGLDEWDATAAGLRTGMTHGSDSPADLAARDRRIDEIKRELEASLAPGSPPVDVDIFLDLPEVRDVVVELFDKVTLSANGERSG